MVANSQATNPATHNSDEINNLDRPMTSNKKEAGVKKNLPTKMSPWQDGLSILNSIRTFKEELIPVFLNIENEGRFPILFTKPVSVTKTRDDKVKEF